MVSPSSPHAPQNSKGRIVVFSRELLVVRMQFTNDHAILGLIGFIAAHVYGVFSPAHSSQHQYSTKQRDHVEISHSVEGPIHVSCNCTCSLEGNLATSDCTWSFYVGVSISILLMCGIALIIRFLLSCMQSQPARPIAGSAPVRAGAIKSALAN